MMYFDNAATTMVSESIIDTVNHYMKEHYGNAGSIHNKGIEAKNDLEEARKTIAGCIGAKSEQIIFTSCGSESNSLAIVGLMKYLKKINKLCIISSEIEHPSVLAALDYAKDNGFIVHKLPVNNDGKIDVKSLETQIHKLDVGLVSIMAVNNEVGSVQEIAEIGKVCRKNNIFFHTDCVQAVGTIEINVNEMCIDFLSMSGHKFHAPKGVGILYARNKEVLNPIIFGGNQEFSLRAGTENIPGIMGMAEALKDVYKTPVLYVNIKKCFVKHIEELCKEENIEVYFNGDSKTNQSKIVNLRFPNVDGQTLVLMCSNRNLCVSAGSACKANSNNPSHVLMAIGLTEDEALSSIRVSFSKYNTIQEALSGAEIIVRCVKEMLGNVYE